MSRGGARRCTLRSKRAATEVRRRRHPRCDRAPGANHGVHTDVHSAHRSDHQEFDTLLRYLRWKVTGHGDATEIVFTLTGLAY